MAFILRSNIIIGAYKNVKPNEVKIQKSMFSFCDKATIKLPVTARVKQEGRIVTETTDTAKLFNEGDKVEIALGYNDTLNNEFKGFVTRVNLATPIEIECEGYSFLLRQKNYTKTFKHTTVKEIVNFLIEGTGILLDPKTNYEIRPIDKFVLNGENGTEALEKLKKETLVDVFFSGETLYAGLLYGSPKKDTRYRIGWNVIKDNNLKLRQAKNQDVTIRYLGVQKDGKRNTIKVGDKLPQTKTVVGVGKAGTTGETKIFKSHTVTDSATLEAMANKKMGLLKYDGYEGKITAFILPYTEPGYRAILEDLKYPERSGKYIVQSVEINYGMSGARRVVEIGAKL